MILLVSDLHSPKPGELDEIEYLIEESEAAFLLGDIRKEHAELIAKRIKTHFIYGNHNYQSEYDFPGNIHKKVVEISGLKFAGVEGCIAYKESDTMHTKEEYDSLVLPEHDILLCHDNVVNLTENKPKLLIHGHCHENTVYKIGNTLCISIYKCASLNPKDLSLRFNF